MSLHCNLFPILRFLSEKLLRQFRHRFRHRWTISLSSIHRTETLHNYVNTDNNNTSITGYYTIRFGSGSVMLRWFLRVVFCQVNTAAFSTKHPKKVSYKLQFALPPDAQGEKEAGSTQCVKVKQLMAKPAQVCSHVWFKWSQPLWSLSRSCKQGRESSRFSIQNFCHQGPWRATCWGRFLRRLLWWPACRDRAWFW